MATLFKLPMLGQTMQEGTILKWYKAEGDKVEGWETLLEVMTDKVNMEVDPQVSGVLRKILETLVKSFYRESAEQPQSTPGKSLLATLAGYSCRPRRSETQLNYRCPDLQKGQRIMGQQAGGFSRWLFPPAEPSPQIPPYWDVVHHPPDRVSASLYRQPWRRNNPDK